MKTLILLVGISISTICLGQNYNTAIGVKGGYYFTGGAALSVKHFMGSSSAFEINAGGGRYHLWVQALYERNMAIGDRGLDWYWGLGGDLGIWSYGHRYYYPRGEVYYTGAWGGVDALLGLEYTFPNAPINLALDAGPTIRLFPYVGVGVSSALALRFAIK